MVKQRPKGRVAGREVTEFVGENAADLGDSQDLQQWQTNAHDPGSAQPQQSAALHYEGVESRQKIHFTRRLLASPRSDVPDQLKQPRLILSFQERTGDLEDIPLRQKRFQNGPG